MIKVLELFHRRADLDPDAFISHWQTRHTDVVMGLPGIQRYVQNPVLHALTPEASYDGIVELWFPDLDVMRANGRSDYWPLVVADEERFIDRTTTALMLIDDPLPPAVKPGLKVFTLLSRAADATESGFRDAVLAQAAHMQASVDFPRHRPHNRPIADAVVARPCRDAADVATTLVFPDWRHASWTVQQHLAVEARPILVQDQ